MGWFVNCPWGGLVCELSAILIIADTVASRSLFPRGVPQWDLLYSPRGHAAFHGQDHSRLGGSHHVTAR